MKYEGHIFKYGRDVNTDVIIPARYMNTSDPKELSKYTMIDLDPDFVYKVKPGDIIVAEENFGCGSSREHAPIAIKASGIDCVIARSFARIFYRNAINTGLAIMECPDAVDDISFGDEVEVDTKSGIITNKTTGHTFRSEPFPEFISEIIAQGGLVNRTRNVLGIQKPEAK